MPYSYVLAATNLTSLSSRRDDLSRNFFSQYYQSYILFTSSPPPPRSNAVTSRLRSYEIYPRPSTRTKRYCSLVLTVWPFSLLEQDCQQLMSIRLTLHMLVISIINSYYYYFYYCFYSTRPTSVYTYFPAFLSHSFNSNCNSIL